MNPDRLAELEEERDFLLRSLSDLDREHDAGDVDDADYQSLRDDYTARAAGVLRAIEDGRAALPRRRRLPPRTVLAAFAVSALLIGGISWFLTRSLQDDASSASTVPVKFCPPAVTDTNSLLVDARTAIATDPSCALDLFKLVLEQNPDNVEARTYTGWVIAFDAMSSGMQGEELKTRGEQALKLIDSARTIDPAYVDAQCFTAIIRYRFLGDAAGAKEPLEKCRAGKLPDAVAPLVQALGAKIDAALAGTSDSSLTGDSGGSTATTSVAPPAST